MSTPRILAVGEELPPLVPDAPPPAAAPRPKRPKGPARPRRRRSAAADRFGLLNDFIDREAAGLNRAELAVWLTLYRDTRDGQARAGRDDLARRSGCDRSTVTRAVASLIARGLLERVRAGGIGRGPATYRVSVRPQK